jgi:hypothetical protein
MEGFRRPSDKEKRFQKAKETNNYVESRESVSAKN